MSDLTELEQLKALIDTGWKNFAYGDDGDGFNHITNEEGDDRRWSRTITTIVQSEATELFYAFDWEHGLTEVQENECDWPDVRQVERRERVVTVVDYVEVAK